MLHDLFDNDDQDDYDDSSKYSSANSKNDNRDNNKSVSGSTNKNNNSSSSSSSINKSCDNCKQQQSSQPPVPLAAANPPPLPLPATLLSIPLPPFTRASSSSGNSVSAVSLVDIASLYSPDVLTSLHRLCDLLAIYVRDAEAEAAAAAIVRAALATAPATVSLASAISINNHNSGNNGAVSNVLGVGNSVFSGSLDCAGISGGLEPGPWARHDPFRTTATAWLTLPLSQSQAQTQSQAPSLSPQAGVDAEAAAAAVAGAVASVAVVVGLRCLSHAVRRKALWLTLLSANAGATNSNLSGGVACTVSDVRARLRATKAVTAYTSTAAAAPAPAAAALNNSVSDQCDALSHVSAAAGAYLHSAMVLAHTSIASMSSSLNNISDGNAAAGAALAVAQAADAVANAMSQRAAAAAGAALALATTAVTALHAANHVNAATPAHNVSGSGGGHWSTRSMTDDGSSVSALSVDMRVLWGVAVPPSSSGSAVSDCGGFDGGLTSAAKDVVRVLKAILSTV